MQVANTSKFVHRLGRIVLEPGDTTFLDDELWASHKALEEMERRGLVRCDRTSSFSLSEDERKLLRPEPETHVAQLARMFDLDIPEDWENLNANSAKAWIRRCDNLPLLAKLAAVEDRPKILEALRAQIAMREATS